MGKPWLLVALAYVGAVVGAGFASGQEIWQFFGRHGPAGLVGIAGAGACFLGFGYLALEHGRRGVARMADLLGAVYPRWLVMAGDGVMTLFLGAGLVAVVAGAGALGRTLVGISGWTGGLITAALVLGAAMRGTRMVLVVNTGLMPVLIVLTAAVAIGARPSHSVPLSPEPASGHWLGSALLYVSYNLLGSLVLLLSLGRELSSRRHSFLAALTAGGILSVLAALEHRAVSVLPLSPLGMPMVEAARHIHPVVGAAYGVTLWIALFTTGVAEAFALISRFGPRVVPWLALSAGCSTCGFGDLVATAYPAMGIAALWLWIPLLFAPVRPPFD